MRDGKYGKDDMPVHALVHQHTCTRIVAHLLILSEAPSYQHVSLAMIEAKGRSDGNNKDT